jgi:hypothetical protein
MVINDPDVVDISLSPGEAHPPLVMNPHTMLPLAVVFQGLKLVAWRDLQVLERVGAMELQQPPPRDSLEAPTPRDIQVRTSASVSQDRKERISEAKSMTRRVIG